MFWAVPGYPSPSVVSERVFPSQSKVIHRHHFPQEKNGERSSGGLLASENRPRKVHSLEDTFGGGYVKLLHQMVLLLCCVREVALHTSWAECLYYRTPKDMGLKSKVLRKRHFPWDLLLLSSCPNRSFLVKWFSGWRWCRKLGSRFSVTRTRRELRRFLQGTRPRWIPRNCAD